MGSWPTYSNVAIRKQLIFPEFPNALLSAIIEHLRPYKERLENRATKQAWYELQQPQMRYTSEFDNPKIVFPDIAKESRFAFDNTGAYPANTVYVLPREDFYLLGVLNSRMIWEYAKETLTVLGDANKGGRLRFFRQFVEKLPIPDAPAAERKAIATLAQQCVEAKGEGAQVAAWEAEIDARVARLYGLSEEELRAVRGE
jgi:hypothetical protein